ncbi:MAG: hypothetical protein ACI3XJ_03610 [Oscillospiraceae bacterium]
MDGSSWVSLFSKLDQGYYRQELPKKQRVQVRALYICLFLASAALFLAAAAQGLKANNVWYVVVPEIIVLICMFRIMAAFITYMSVGQEMSSADHNRSSFALKRTSLGAAIFQTLACIGALVYMCKDGGVSGQGVLASCLFFASAIPMVIMFLVEKSILYTRISDPAKE